MGWRITLLMYNFWGLLNWSHKPQKRTVIMWQSFLWTALSTSLQQSDSVTTSTTMLQLPGKLTGHVTSFGKSNWRGLSCRAAADSSSSGLCDPAAISSAVNSKSARLSSCSVWNDLGATVDDTGLLTDGTLALTLADSGTNGRYFVSCSLCRLRELQFDAVSSSCD